ncbi:histone acetyltransferase KAT6B isoform X3 [Gossypium australe]|uniref:Histone acetyltransferase KAT6B isoform X3 n=1 Tax=Gossypium australe TaxID=47621 RepID=A0A5B6WLV9_9ROSI|nr:histone acetyltransferase KAT6B isoform X3 [Gossypium australe]
MVSDSDLVARLREILRDSDLDTATAGSVRKQLEKDFGIDLSDRKSFVRDQIDIFLETLNRDNEKEGEDEQAPESENEELQEENDDEEEEESKGEGSQNTRQVFFFVWLRSKSDKKTKKRGGGFQTVCSLSPQLQKVVGESKLARTEVVKKLWVYIKEKDLQDPKNKRNIICDELLRDIFRVNSINMFQMNKALTKHIWPLSVEDEDSNHEMECEDNDDSASMNAESAKGEVKEEEKEEDDSVSMNAESAKGEENEEEKEEDDSESLNAENSKEGKEEEKEGEQEEEEDNEEEEEEEEQEGNSRRSKKKRSSKGDKDVKRRGGGFTKLCSLSPQLQAFIGESELARTEVVKRLWTYIREKNLQDPKDKRNVLCDDSLYALFRVKSINMFQMNKALSKHIWPLNEEEVQADSAKTERKSKQARERVADEPKQKEKKQKKGASGFLAPLPLSDALVKFFATGENALSRADVVKKMWEYIKQNDLQDPSDKRRILCDDKLKELFEVDSFNGFAMTKLLTTHFIKMEQ